MKLFLVKILVCFVFLSCKQNTDEKAVIENAFATDSLKVLKLFEKGKIYSPQKLTINEDTLWYGNIFNNSRNYLVIKDYSIREKIYYLYDNKQLKEMFRYSVAGGSRFISDTIYDANQDSLLDVLTKHRYRSNSVDEYYLQNKKATFNTPVRLYNSVQKGNQLLGCFTANSPILRFYKYKWNGYALDTIEYVSCNYMTPSKKRYYSSKEMHIFEMNDDGEYFVAVDKNKYQTLDKLPLEYTKLDCIYLK